MIHKGKKLYEGKAKIIYEGPEKGTGVQHFKDDATAFNNLKKSQIEGKGVLNNRISEHILKNLNQIGIKNTLTFNLTADSDNSETITIVADINYPTDNSIANTYIEVQQSDCNVYHDNVLCETVCSCEYISTSGITIGECLQSGPNSLSVSGISSLNGEGTLLRDETKTISCDFELKIPFEMINEDINMFPSKETALEPLDENTSESINNSLIEAALISNIENHMNLFDVVEYHVLYNIIP